MKTWLIAGVGLIALSGCGGSPEAVGENSTGSIKTTAVGEVVATPSPTAPPTVESNVTITANDTVAAADASEHAATEAADNAATTH